MVALGFLANMNIFIKNEWFSENVRLHLFFRYFFMFSFIFFAFCFPFQAFVMFRVDTFAHVCSVRPPLNCCPLNTRNIDFSSEK